METRELQSVIERAQKLSPNEQLKLIKHLAEKLARSSMVEKKEPQYLKYGKYRDYPGKMSSEEDFKIAEWHPTDEELNGD